MLTTGQDFREYVLAYTNAATIVDESYRDSEDLDGLFSGWNDETRTYDISSWQPARDERGEILRDESLSHHRSVYQILRRHFSRYTSEFVSNVTGVSEAQFLEVAQAICDNSRRDRTTAFAYAVAWTQHTTGTQMIGACALLQLLLGNIGRPGGGIMALRGHATIQGSTDIPTLFNLLPGYLPMPTTQPGHDNLDGYLETVTRPAGQWRHAPSYMVSLLKAFYGDAATAENEFGYALLPRIAGDYSFQEMTTMMVDGVIKGLFCLGQNPAVGGQNGRLAREGLATLDWLVVRDLFEIETAAFWKDAPEVTSGERPSSTIPTEVFLLPAAVTPEKDGSYTNTQRLIQWHEAAVAPPGDARSEAWFLHALWKRLRSSIADDDSPAAAQLRSLSWDFDIDQDTDEPLAESVLREINGFRVETGTQIGSFDDLRADGSTVCGCWIYAGVMPDRETNRAKSRKSDGMADSGWGFAWPGNRRTLYNLASADPGGGPWSEEKAWIWWDEKADRWLGFDEPDLDHTLAQSPETPRFVMMPDGLGQLFVHAGLNDGPLPVHYEPIESIGKNRLHPNQSTNPAAKRFERDGNHYHSSPDPVYPHVLTTYRLTEHHTAGAMSRNVPWLAELQPEAFAEIDTTLAAGLCVQNGDWVVVSTARGEVEVKALVTERIQPLMIDGKQIHQIGMPWHFGYSGLATGGSANDLSALAEDPNSLIHEGKSLTCSIRVGRLKATLKSGYD